MPKSKDYRHGVQKSGSYWYVCSSAPSCRCPSTGNEWSLKYWRDTRRRGPYRQTWLASAMTSQPLHHSLRHSIQRHQLCCTQHTERVPPQSSRPLDKPPCRYYCNNICFMTVWKRQLGYCGCTLVHRTRAYVTMASTLCLKKKPDPCYLLQ